MEIVPPFVLMCVMHLMGVVGFYEYIWWGRCTHVVGGMFMASVGIFYLGNPLMVALIGGILWEIFEYGFDSLFPKYSYIVSWYSRSFTGALWDIGMGMVGASVMYLVWM